MCLGKNYMMPFFCKWPSPGLNKQSWCWKKNIWFNILTCHSYTTSSDWFLYHHDHAKNLFASMA